MARKLKSETVRIAYELGLREDFVRVKVEEALKIAGGKGIDFSRPVLVGFDAQGPQVRTIDANFTPLLNIQKAILAIWTSPLICLAIISGWDRTTLASYRDRRLGIKHMRLIGESGAVFEDEGKLVMINPISEEEHFTMKQRIFVESAKAGLKIAIQGNNSRRVMSVYFEGDEPDRGDLRSYFLVKDTDISTLGLYELFREKSLFEFDGKLITFVPDIRTVKEIDYVLSKARPLQSVRLAWNQGRIVMWRDNVDNRGFTLKDMERFAKEISIASWEMDANPDFCVDFAYKGDGQQTSKEHAANALAKRRFGTDNFAITNVGDKKGDVFFGRNAISFTLYGTEADEYCQKNGIPHVSVVSGVDYALVMAEILNREEPPRDLETETLLADVGKFLSEIQR